MSATKRLTAVKVLHTIIWAFFAACIVTIPVFAWAEMYGAVLWLTGIVLVEILVLALNGWACPLTGVAARYTEERHDNFDIYLPLRLARYNKQIFGSLFIVGQLFVLLRWSGWVG